MSRSKSPHPINKGDAPTMRSSRRLPCSRPCQGKVADDATCLNETGDRHPWERKQSHRTLHPTSGRNKQPPINSRRMQITTRVIRHGHMFMHSSKRFILRNTRRLCIPEFPQPSSTNAAIHTSRTRATCAKRVAHGEGTSSKHRHDLNGSNCARQASPPACAQDVTEDNATNAAEDAAAQGRDLPPSKPNRRCSCRNYASGSHGLVP